MPDLNYLAIVVAAAAALILGPPFLPIFVGAIVASVLFTFFAIPFASMALSFGPPELFAVLLIAFGTFVGLGGSPAMALVMMAAGFLLSTVGLDVVTGQPRLTFGTITLDQIGPLTTKPTSLAKGDARVETGQQLGTTGVPESFLVSPTGELVLHSLGPVDDRRVHDPGIHLAGVARRHLEGDTLQDHPFGIVAELHVLEADPALAYEERFRVRLVVYFRLTRENAEHDLDVGDRLLDLAVEHPHEVQRDVELDQHGVDHDEIADGARARHHVKDG